MPLWQLQAPSAIALQLGAFSIRWYGICLILGIFAAYWLVLRLRQKNGESKQIIEQLFLPVVISGIIGGRLLHVILEWSYYSDNLWQIPQIWLGGLAIHGAIMGGGLALYIVCRRQKITFLPLLDQLVIGLALAQAIGRWGNYFNQELYGAPISVGQSASGRWWGILINEEFRIKNYESFSLFHPIFLYESLGLIALSGVLLIFYKRKITGLTTALYLVGYGLIRFLVDFLRIDPQLAFGGLRFGQWVSLLFIICGLILVFRSKKKV